MLPCRDQWSLFLLAGAVESEGAAELVLFGNDAVLPLPSWNKLSGMSLLIAGIGFKKQVKERHSKPVHENISSSSQIWKDWGEVRGQSRLIVGWVCACKPLSHQCSPFMHHKLHPHQGLTQFMVSCKGLVTYCGVLTLAGHRVPSPTQQGRVRIHNEKNCG